MKLQELQTLIIKDLDSKNLKNPAIRKNALNKIVKFIEDTNFYINQEGDLSLPDRKNLEINYKKHKGKEINGAEKNIIKLIYKYYTVPEDRPAELTIHNTIISDSTNSEDEKDFAKIEKKLISGIYIAIGELEGGLSVPDEPGIYCIKLKEGITLPQPYSRKSIKKRIIYIGISSTSLRNRLWKQELNHFSPATFFRSIGAILGYLPERSSLYGRETNNYKFSETDTEKIKNWIKESLMVNFLPLPASLLDNFEKRLIVKYTPLVNIKGNPIRCVELVSARKRCVEIAKYKSQL